MQAILKGLRIVEGSAFIAAPMCGMTLAQLGADVIRFDQLGIGIYPVCGTPMYFSKIERQPPRAAPRVGQHTDEILADVLGLDSAVIGRLHDQGVVAGAE